MSFLADRRFRAAAFAAVMLSTGLVVACSRPTPVPSPQNVQPGPFPIDAPPDQGYPPKVAATNVPPYPDPDDADADADATATITATMTITP